jgi:cytochrome c biogenesis protein CcmG/thiol:disulfide interchange protein DsbE
LVLLVALVAAGVGVAVSSSGPDVVDALVERSHEPAPAFALPEVLDPGRTMRLASFRGKPLVLNFWASWCYPCQAEMPLLEAVYRSERGAVQFVGVDTDDSRAAAAKFMHRTHVTYLSLFMPRRGAVSASYQLVGLPITVFISSDGRVLGRHIGPLNRATLDVALTLAFGSPLGR